MICYIWDIYIYIWMDIYIYIIITINSIFHTADVPIFSRSLAPYLADPDARVRLAVVEAAVTEKNPAKRVRFA